MAVNDFQAERFRRTRERAGLTIADVAARAGLSEGSVWDLESFDDELTLVYGPSDLARLTAVLGTSPAELLGLGHDSDPIGPAALAVAVRIFCETAAVTVAEFEEACGWHVADALDHPRLFLDAFSIDGIRDVCRAVHLPWEPFASGWPSTSS